MAVCSVCDEEYADAREALGYSTCLECGEKQAKVVTDHLKRCSAPLFSKGAYQPVMSKEDARSINSKFWRK